MSRELSLYEAMGGTYTDVEGILYPNISVAGFILLTIRRKKLGLGDAKFPTSSCPCIYRAELALPYATYPELMPI